MCCSEFCLTASWEILCQVPNTRLKWVSRRKGIPRNVPAFQLSFHLWSALPTLLPQRDRLSPLQHFCLFCFASLLFQGTPGPSFLPLEVTGNGGGKARADGENRVVLAGEAVLRTSLHVGHSHSCQRQMSPVHSCTDPERCIIEKLSKTTARPLVLFSFSIPAALSMTVLFGNTWKGTPEQKTLQQLGLKEPLIANKNIRVWKLAWIQTLHSPQTIDLIRILSQIFLHIYIIFIGTKEFGQMQVNPPSVWDWASHVWTKDLCEGHHGGLSAEQKEAELQHLHLHHANNRQENPAEAEAYHFGCRPLTLGFLHENHFGIGAEVLPGQDHLLASQNRAVVRVLLLHHGKLVCRPLSWRGDTDRRPMGQLWGRGAFITQGTFDLASLIFLLNIGVYKPSEGTLSKAKG